RVLYARAGQPYCVEHDVPISKLSKEEMIRLVLDRITARSKSAEMEVMGVLDHPTLRAPLLDRRGVFGIILFILL
ncbi:MAG: hypothetical protein AAB975_00555, partial [Patescibacteria group bacterium]